jgi:hypothetical protein
MGSLFHTRTQLVARAKDRAREIGGDSIEITSWEVPYQLLVDVYRDSDA